MNTLILIVFVPIIALAQQGLFFSLDAAEDFKTNTCFFNAIEKSRYEQALQYTERGLVDLAVPELKKAIELYPDDIKTHAYLGWAYSQKGLIAEAVEEFQKVLRINPDLQRMPFDYPMAKNIPVKIKEFTTIFEDMIDYIDEFPGAHAELGLYYVLQGRLGDALNEYKKTLELEPAYGKRDLTSVLNQAINEYEDVLKLKPDCVEAYIKLACAHAENGMPDLSIADMEKAISIEPERVETHLYLGYLYAKRQMLDEAVKELSEAKKLGDGIIEKLLKEGERGINECAFDKAISVAKDIIRIAPKNKKAYGLLATAYSKNGDSDKAVEIYKEIIHLFPDDRHAYILLGWIYAQCDSFEYAENIAEQATRQNHDNAETMALLAFIYASQNRINDAIAMCNMAINKTSAKDAIFTDYGWIKGNVSSIEQKFREVMDVVEIKPDYTEAYLCLGWLHSKNGESEKAVTAFKKAIELTPDSYNAHLCLGSLYAQKGEIKDALNEYNKALEIQYKKVQDKTILGLSYFKNGDVEQAIDYFNDVLKFNPEYTDAYFLLADAYEKKGLYSVSAVLRSQGEKLKQR